MKKTNPPPPPEFALEVEIARRRALHHVHDSSRILVDVMHYTDTNHRQAYTEIVGALNTGKRARSKRDMPVSSFVLALALGAFV